MTSLWFFVLAVWLVYTSGAPLDEENAEIIEYENEPNAGNGTYYFTFDDSDGTSRWEKAEVKYTAKKQPYLSVTGQYSYYGSDGKIYTVEYTADENGYRAELKAEEDDVVPRISPALLASLQG